jgi:hypothetical protein
MLHKVADGAFLGHGLSHGITTGKTSH